MQFNLHTHKAGPRRIYNLRIGYDSSKNDYSSFISAGIHPWDIGFVDAGKSFKLLEKSLLESNCLAMGECGLDKNYGTDLDCQRKVFREQLLIAKRCKKRVLIIHCVKAYQEILEEKLNSKNDFVWILHAFNGGEQLIKQMSRHGFYFSLGRSLFNPKTKIAQFAPFIPKERLFLETDDSEYEINDVYSRASEILNISEKELELQIERNLDVVFPELLI